MTLPSAPGISLLSAGRPPVGLGIFDRSQRVPGPPWIWHASYPARARAGDWVFVGVEAMAIGSWRVSLARAVEVAVSRFASGVIVNPERLQVEWANAPQSEFDALSDALCAAALRTRIGFVSIPAWPVERMRFRGLVWGGMEWTRNIGPNLRGWERWRRVFGARLIPSLFTPHGVLPPAWPDIASFRAYVESIPRTGGAIVWPGYPVEPYAIEVLTERYASPTAALTMLPLSAFSALDTWPGLLFLVLFTLLVVGSLLGGTRGA